MKPFQEYLEEARRNKDHPSQRRVDALDILAPYAGRDDIHITYVKVDKVGINTKSKYPDTPVGVYAFPLRAVWEDINTKGLENVPFKISGAKWVYVLEESANIMDVSRYTSSDFNRDVSILKRDKGEEYIDGIVSYYQNGNFGGVNPEVYNKTWFSIHSNTDDKWVSQKLSVVQREWDRYPFIRLKSLMGEIVNEGRFSRKVKKQNVELTRLYRKMGYDGLSDKTGIGLIHPAEKFQIVFLNPGAYKIVDKITINRDLDFKDFDARASVAKARHG